MDWLIREIATYIMLEVGLCTGAIILTMIILWGFSGSDGT